MKKTLLTLLSVLFCAITFAQTVPQGINYQAVARDATGDVLMNQALTIQFSVISDITTSAVSWQETHTVTTNDYGLFTAIIGQGTATSVGSSATFDVIDWGASNHLLKVEIDYGGGLVDMGTTAFMSVPYALYSAAGSSTSTCLSIGDTAQGGIVFYVSPDGKNGLVAATIDQNGGTIINWYNASDVISNPSNHTLEGQKFLDWRLPTKYELNAMYSNIGPNSALGNIGGFSLVSYWSSTEDNYDVAWTQGFYGGYQASYDKHGYYTSVRAVRALANTDDGSCIINGCTNPIASNYNPLANTDDGSCIIIINGCTDSTALNYNPLANTDDGSCVAVVNGCTDSTALNYNPLANTDNGSCILPIYGCMDSTMGNFNPLANTDDGSCIACINGCMNSTATNYDSTATCDDGSCVVEGCTTSGATNYNSSANVDDGSCIFPNGTPCSDGDDCTYNDMWINGACQGMSYSCDDGDPCTIDVCDGVGGCVYTSTCSLQIGQTYQGGIIFYLDGNGGGLICDTQDLADAEWGCYGTNITGADGTAIGTGNQNTIDIEAGCITPGIAADICANYTDGTYSDWFLPSKDELNKMYLNIGQGNALGLGNIGGFSSNNYWSSSEYNATKSKRQDFFNGYQGDSYKSDTLHVRAVRAFGILVSGCTDSTATNYDPLANTDDGSCTYTGCTDSTATNYNPLANTDDGSCIYLPFTGVIGVTYQGGIVFYLDGNGGGLIAAPSDQSNGAQWGCYGTAIPGADGTAIGTGNQNTIDIEAGCITPGTAADICANLTLGGYSDWFLPSKDELNKMYLNIGQGNALLLGNIGGFANNYYWSSTEIVNLYAWLQSFTSGSQFYGNKHFTSYVRAVRAF